MSLLKLVLLPHVSKLDPVIQLIMALSTLLLLRHNRLLLKAQQPTSQENLISANSNIDTAGIDQINLQKSSFPTKHSAVSEVSPQFSSPSGTANEQGSPNESLQNSPQHSSGYLNVSPRGPRSCTLEDLRNI